MTTESTSVRRTLLSPAMIVALLALVISLSSGAYALTVTGANIKNNTVTTKDIKNNSLKGKDIKDGSVGARDLADLALGSRAVASVYSDGSTCTVIASQSRGATSCTRNGVGWYQITLSAKVDISNTRPVCLRGSNGGFNSIYTFVCEARFVDGGVEINVSRVTETTTSSPIAAYDQNSSSPLIVVVP